MAIDSKLYLQVADGRLWLAPRCNLSDGLVKEILRTAQLGFRMFSVVVVDLQEVAEVGEDTLARLEEGLRQLIAAKKHAFCREPGKWTLQSDETSGDACHCHGNCRDCACRPPGEAAKKQVNTG